MYQYFKYYNDIYMYQQDFKTYKMNHGQNLTIEINSKHNMIDDNMKIDIIILHVISPVIVK